VCFFFFFLFSQGGQLVGPMPVLAACHLIYICSIIALYCYSFSGELSSLSLSLSDRQPLRRLAVRTCKGTII